jgi:alkyldihydroxyacetonephosphate synthase
VIAGDLVGLGGLTADDVVAPAPPRYRHDLWPTTLKRGSSSNGDAVLVRPRTTAAVAALLDWAGERGLRVLPFGAGTNVVGAVDGEADVVLSLERMTRITSLDAESQIVTAEAGLLGGELERALNERDLTLGHYPQSLEISTVGGWVSTRATGTYSARFGGIERMLCGLTVVLGSGEVLELPPRVRASGGLDLLALVCGAEGTLGVITEVSLTVQRRLAERIVCVGFAGLAEGLEAQRDLVQQGYRIGLLRLYNVAETRAILPEGASFEPGCLLISTALAPEGLVDAEAEAIAAAAATRGVRLDASYAEPWLTNRYRAAGLMESRNAAAGLAFDTIEASVPWASAVACATELESAFLDVSEPFFLHFSHAYTSGVGLYLMLHLRGDSDADVVDHLREAWESALDIVVRHGGTIGHHHGIGTVRSARYLASPDGRVHMRLKRALDERNVLASGLLAGGASQRAVEVAP